MNLTLLLQNIKVPLGSTRVQMESQAFSLAEKILNQSPVLRNFGKPLLSIRKRSVDARGVHRSGRAKPGCVYFVYTVAAVFPEDVEYRGGIFGDDGGFNRCSGPCSHLPREIVYCARRYPIEVLEPDAPLDLTGRTPFPSRPVVVGFGPCGMFCALLLARAGFRPIVLERGADAERRKALVGQYWATGEVDCSTNVQFGEGGAGMFSDGKLLSRIHDRLVSFVFQTFCEHGADKDILIDAKPHIGTDRLAAIIMSIRREILSLGGEVRFCEALTSISFGSAGQVQAIGVNGERESIPARAVFLAIGHSARDTFLHLMGQGLEIVPKAYSVGVRIEHLQQDINRSLYGPYADHPLLPPAEYTLSCHCHDRAVYSFCMCPGGTVVASASDRGEIVTNGMSNSKRDGINANSALCVTVRESDYGNSPQGAIAYQQSIERAAFALASGGAPVETVGRFLGQSVRSEFGRVSPSYTGAVKTCSLAALFSPEITQALQLGIQAFERNIRGFSAPDALLTAPETRTSCPVRILRMDDRMATGHPGVYPCGEGAGYAGGITSAAVDGLRAALAFLSEYRPSSYCLDRQGHGRGH